MKKLDSLTKKRMEEVAAMEAETAAAKSLIDGKKELDNNDDPTPPSPPGGNNDKTSGQREAMNDALRKTETEHLEELSKIKNRYLSGDIATEYEYNQKLLDQQDIYDEDRKKQLNELLNTTLSDKSVRIEALKQIADIEEKNFDRRIQQAGKIRKILLDADPVEAEKQTYENRLREVGLFGKEKEDMTEEQQKAYELLLGQHLENMRKIDAKGVREKLEAIETEQNREETLLAQKRQQGLLTEGAYLEELLKLQKKYLNQKLAVPGLSQVQTENLNQKASENDTDTVNAKTDERKQTLDRYGLIPPKSVMEEAYTLIADFEARGVLSHEEALKAKARIDQDYLDALTDKVGEASGKIQNVTSNLSSAISSFQEAETTAVTRKYDNQIKAAGKNDKKVKKLEEEKQKELNKIKAKYADKQFAVTVAQVIATTALTAMESYKAMAGIPVVGPVLGAVAAGAGQIAIAKEQREAAKEGYATGGFTPSGPWDKPQGVVHSDEFIANRFAAGNPMLRPVFDVVDYAQRNNTLGSLKKEDIARALGINGFASGGYVNPGTATVRSKESEPAYWDALIEVIDRLDKKLDKPFVGEVSITGRKGVKENMDLYNKMIKNVSR